MNRAYSVRRAAADRTGLVIGLKWWIPGILLACGYVVYMYSTLPAKFGVHHTEDH